jgi:hypothetical protein
VAGIVLGMVVFGDSIRVSRGLILLGAFGLIALLIGVILVARSPALPAAAQIPPTPGFELHPARKMAAPGSWHVRRRRGVG